MSLANLKIGTRLGLGFAVVLALLATILLLGLGSLAHIGSKTHDIVSDKNVKVAAVNALTANVRDVGLAVSNMAAVPGFAAMQTELAKVAEARKRYAAAREALGKKLSEEKEKALVATADAAIKNTVEKNDAFIALRQAGQLPEARVLLVEQAGPALREALKALDAIVAHETELARDAGAEAEAVATGALATMSALGLLAIGLGAVVAWWITRSITQPLNKALRVAETVAAGDLSSTIEVKSTDETGRLLSALKAMNDSLLAVVGQVRSGTDTMATAANEIAAGNMDLSARTESQASSLEETAASMEELTGTVKQNADNARQANQLAATASQVAVKGGALVSKVVDTMGAISASSAKIADIIGVIDGIAFQTNILALNAAVEAARAGEQGRGFAVVATEVRNLAHRSASAAKEIKELIAASVVNVDAGSALVNDAGHTMGEIVSSIQRVTDIMSEISFASTEQTSGIEQINMAVTQMDETTQQNAALVEQAAAASQSMQEQAALLAQVVGFFKTGVVEPAAPAAVKRQPVPLKRTAPATRKALLKPAPVAHAASDWEEF